MTEVAAPIRGLDRDRRDADDTNINKPTRTARSTASLT